jgi:alpha-tubulin suppressor-like RCC1 family protein
VASLATVVSVSVNQESSCAITSDQSVWCWGNNSSGQLGNGMSVGSSSDVPTRVVTGPGGPAFSGAVQIAVFGAGACAVKSDDTLSCWGQGYNGQVGPFVYSGAAVSGVFSLGIGLNISWIDTKGVYHHSQGMPETGSDAVPCP